MMNAGKRGWLKNEEEEAVMAHDTHLSFVLSALAFVQEPAVA